METRKSELLKIVQGSSELVKKAGNIQLPSWRFPEKLAVLLDVEETLKGGPSGIDKNVFFLELLIDRSRNNIIHSCTSVTTYFSITGSCYWSSAVCTSWKKVCQEGWLVLPH